MREIEFRGKQTHTGEWHYGYLVYVPVDNSYKITQGKEISYFVNADTIGQYTGLKDKNGTKIFEGDIVKILTEPIYNTNFVKKFDCGVIEYDEEFVEYKISFSHIRNDEEDSLMNFRDRNDLEVIGNIYDNPELLK